MAQWQCIILLEWIHSSWSTWSPWIDEKGYKLVLSYCHQSMTCLGRPEDPSDAMWMHTLPICNHHQSCWQLGSMTSWDLCHTWTLSAAQNNSGLNHWTTPNFNNSPWFNKQHHRPWSTTVSNVVVLTWWGRGVIW